MSAGSPHADSGSIAYCGKDMWLENGTLEDSIIDSSSHRPSVYSELPNVVLNNILSPLDGKTAVTILAYLPGDDGILRKSKTAVLLATITTTTRCKALLQQLFVWGPVPSAHAGLDASLAAAAAARRVMAEELAGCTVRMVAHRGAALADSLLRVDMASGRIRAVTKDRIKKDDGEVDDDEGMAVGGGWENAMESLAQLAKK
ncbi:hypothetical protein MY1884_003392 [Beauveria asiatica]